MTPAPPVVLLLVEDDPQIRRFLRATLGPHGYELVEAATGREGLALAASRTPGVILLDLGLPDMDGLDVTRRLREWTQVPVVVISARGREADKVAALDAGADDYVTKPFSVPELLARLRVALRHAAALERAGDDEPVLRVGALQLDPGAHRVTLDGREVHLTPIEFKLLELLLRHPGRVLTHRHLLEAVWGRSHAENTSHLRFQMHGLRRKIEAEPARPRYLLTEPGVGYRLRSDDEIS